MDSPFIFVKEVTGEGFVGRKDELSWLSSNMLNSQNSVIIAAPRYGKTTLIRQAALQVQKQDLSIKFCYINMFNIREPYEFYAKLTNELICTMATASDDWRQIAEQYMPLTAPKIYIDTKRNETYLQFDENRLVEHSEELLQMPQRIAQNNNIRLVICIEDFHNVEFIEEDIQFQRRIASIWRKHSNVSYVISGGKKNLMIDLFETEKYPLYNLGEILFLEPIDDKSLVDYIVKSFSKSGRVIQKEFAEKLCHTVKSHPYYTQLFAHLVWQNTKGFVTEALIDSTIDDLLDYNDHNFRQLIETLSNSQVSYLKAIIDGVDRFCSAENIRKYHLHSSANITRVRGALEKKEVIEFEGNKPIIIDPIFELWFRNRHMQYLGVD